MAPILVKNDSSVNDKEFELGAQATLTKVLNLKPGAICIIYETTEKTSWVSYPSLQCVESGLIELAYKTLVED